MTLPIVFTTEPYAECSECGRKMNEFQRDCFETDAECVCNFCFYGDSEDDCTGVGVAYTAVRNIVVVSVAPES